MGKPSRSDDIRRRNVKITLDYHEMRSPFAWFGEIDHQLNTQSGLLGLLGQTSDMRQLLKAVHELHDPLASLAVEVFCHRARKYLGAYLASMGGADAVVFGGGIGERAPDIRARICQGMDWCGLSLDSPRNFEVSDVQAGEAIPIHRKESAIKLLVIGTNEESWVARETFQCLGNAR